LVNDLALRELLVRELRTFRPDAVVANDPEMVFWTDGGVNHTDHRTAGIAAVDAVYPAARNPMAFPWLVREGLAPHRIQRLYLFWSERANVWVDTSTTQDRKIGALREHASQIHDFEELEKRLSEWAAKEGRRIGAGAADAFRLVVIDEDESEDSGPDGEGEAAPSA